MDNPLPDNTRPLTYAEKTDMACDWSDFRKAYGISPHGWLRDREHRAFTAGWAAALQYAERVLGPSPESVANDSNDVPVEGVTTEFERGARAMLEWVQLRTGDGLRDVLLDERDRIDREVPR